jgi:hypothetical protein
MIIFSNITDFITTHFFYLLVLVGAIFSRDILFAPLISKLENFNLSTTLSALKTFFNTVIFDIFTFLKNIFKK